MLCDVKWMDYSLGLIYVYNSIYIADIILTTYICMLWTAKSIYLLITSLQPIIKNQIDWTKELCLEKTWENFHSKMKPEVLPIG